MADDAPAAQAAPASTLPPPTPLGLTPYLTIRGGRGAEALRFYERALGAKALFRNVGQDGKRLMHARFEVNGAVVFLSDDFPDMRGGAETAAPSAVGLHLQVDDADAWAKRAAEAGAEITMPVAEMFWGDRYGQLKDPFGHSWSVGSAARR
jgi:PhnB protein